MDQNCFVQSMHGSSISLDSYVFADFSHLGCQESSRIVKYRVCGAAFGAYKMWLYSTDIKVRIIPQWCQRRLRRHRKARCKQWKAKQRWHKLRVKQRWHKLRGEGGGDDAKDRDGATSNIFHRYFHLTSLSSLPAKIFFSPKLLNSMLQNCTVSNFQ